MKQARIHVVAEEKKSDDNRDQARARRVLFSINKPLQMSEAAGTAGKFLQRAVQLPFVEIRPVNVRKIQFRIGGFVQHEVGEPLFAARTDEKIQRGEPRRIQRARERRVRDGTLPRLSFSAARTSACRPP